MGQITQSCPARFAPLGGWVIFNPSLGQQVASIKPSMIWVGVIALVVLAAVLFFVRGNSSRRPPNPSVIVDMDDQPRTEIDFEAGIRANQNALKTKDKP